MFINIPKISHLINLFVFVFAQSIYSQWEIQTSGVSVNLNDIFFIDSLYGCAVGDSSTILFTEDGGENWTQQISPIDSIKFNKVELLTKNIGIIEAYENTILKTENSGKTWKQLDLPPGYDYSDFSFVSSQKGWISGTLETPTTRYGVIYNTEDGGNSWRKQFELNSDSVGHGNVFVGSIEFLDDTLGWALVGAYFDNFDNLDTYFTNDGGKNWQKVGTTNSLLYDLRVLNKNTIWGDGIVIERSIDGGENWELLEPPSFSESIPRRVSPINENEVFIIMYYFNNKSGELWYTNNFGADWVKKYSFDNFLGYTLTNVHGKYLWIAGQKGFILRGENIITDVVKDITFTPQYFLSHNYPNPFNPTTKINYTIPANLAYRQASLKSEMKKVKLIIYDVLGKEVKTLVNKVQNAGSYEVEFDGTSLPSGIYFYKLQAGDYVQTKKMVLVK